MMRSEINWVSNLLDKILGKWYDNGHGGRSMEFSFSSKGFIETEQQKEEWERGWRDGYEKAYNDYNPFSGQMQLHPSVRYRMNGTGYGNGYDEGARYGRGEISKNKFGDYVSVSYDHNEAWTICKIRYRDGTMKSYFSILGDEALPLLLK